MFQTVKQVAGERGVKADVVLRWIRTGSLEAIDISADGRHRPRWRISTAALAEFDRRRSSSNRIPVKATRRPRTPAGVVEYF
jgi:hypothetical protein